MFICFCMLGKGEHVERLYYSGSFFQDFPGKHFTREPGCTHRGFAFVSRGVFLLLFLWFIALSPFRGKARILFTNGGLWSSCEDFCMLDGY